MIDRTSFHWLVIDGSELGPDLNGGRLVCINGTGDEPLYEYTIDPTKCVTDVPAVFEPLSFAAPVPEPSTWALLLGSMLVSRLWFLCRSARPDGTRR